MTMSPVRIPKPLSKMLQALTKYAPGVGTRFDSWVNEVTGFGTSSDKNTYGGIVPNRTLTDYELSALYHADDMAARMVDIVPQEMMREPFSIEMGDPALDDILTEKFDALDVRGNLADGIRWARLFGGGAVLIGADDGREADRPLNMDRVKDLTYLKAVDRRLLWPLTYYDEPGHPKLGRPQTYMVTTLGGFTYNVITVHETRLLLFRGAPTGIHEKAQLVGWDMSYLQRAFEVLRSFNTGWSAVETLLVDGNQAIFKMTGLAEGIESGNTAALTKRLQIVNLYRSVMRAMVIDADAEEDFSRNSASFTEIPAVLDKFMLRLAAAVQIPVTILMGQSPAGMNATGDSDFRWFYDRIRAQQNAELTPPIRKLAEIWLRSKASPLTPAERAEWFPDPANANVFNRKANGGADDAKRKKRKALTVKYPALWSETPLVQAQRRLAIVQGDVALVTAQIMLPDEIALARAKPGGFDDELRLSDEGKAAREQALTKDLKKLSEGEPDPPPMGGMPGAPGAGGFGAGKPPFGNGGKPNPQFGGKPAPKQLGAGGANPFAKKPKALTFLKADANEGPRTFELDRKVDETGVSGTGIVAQGVVFEDGTVAMRWTTAHKSTTFFDSVEELQAIHGHGGDTTIRWTDERTDGSPDQPREPATGPGGIGGRFAGGSGGGGSEGSGGGSAPSGKGSGGAGSKAAGSGGAGKGGAKIVDKFGRPPPSTSKKDYKPDPTKVGKDGLTEAARVGIAGKDPPPATMEIPRLAGLSKEEREVESRFADAYEKNPQAFVDAYTAQATEQAAKLSEKLGSPQCVTFSTDDAKMLSPDYKKDDVGKALYNVATHQTANAIAKAAFEQHVANVTSKLPADQRNILVTAGGCAAGKGYCLQNAPNAEVNGLSGHAAAIWDTAGEQNSTELPWVQKIAEDHGGRAGYVFVDADPKVSFARVVERAQGVKGVAADPDKGIKEVKEKKPEGRMVDKLLFAESYAIGAANFKAFSEKHADNPSARFYYLSARTPPPSMLTSFPKEATASSVAQVHASASAYIDSQKSVLSPHVYAGGTASDHIWAAGAP